LAMPAELVDQLEVVSDAVADEERKLREKYK
jgi:hypothetical protein